ncbi:hypothetical protein psal_cds_425 [Pandoravirus salinus]|uniref:Uncharacterized protein n=1 Tax=Pandoravirus salinus TaxID=1349410 RepID=S4VUW5_9VIRU|nr:hypothetical protein psal_cds_425 [Pandoravirus salinus]AGO84153.1 hypothetical protein psal_cds_425 [Pandoravirus salinus]
MAPKKKRNAAASDSLSAGAARRRRAHIVTADAVYDAVDQAAVHMGVSRATLCVDVVECNRIASGCVHGVAHFNERLVRVRHPPGMRLYMPNALALLYHEVGHLADTTSHRRRQMLEVGQSTSVLVAQLVGIGLVFFSIAAIESTFVLPRSLARADAAEWSLACVVFVLALYVALGMGRWCRLRPLWHRVGYRLAHDAEKTANRLAVDALLAREDQAGIDAVAVMLASTQRCADRGQKAAPGHPPAHEEQRALVGHLVAAHGLDIVFGPRQGPRQCRRLSMRHVATDTILWNGVFDALPARTRRHRGSQRCRHDKTPRPSLLECVVFGGAHEIVAVVRRIAER